MSSVLTIGHFDGVHLGHRALLSRAREIAQHQGARVIAITFNEHPSSVLRPGTQPPRLLTTREKVARLEAAGADEVIVLEPEPALLAQSAETFIENLVKNHHPVAIVEGEDFRFGRARAGDVEVLRRLGEQMRFQTIVQPKVRLALTDRHEVPVSSSTIRWLVGHGRLRDVARCLLHPFSLTGRIVRGEQQGRRLGIPTANLDPDDYAPFILPPDGVYAGVAHLGTALSTPASADAPSFAAAISLGTKPTFRDRSLTLEAHLLDFPAGSDDGDIYGQTITISFNHWIRDQYAFPSLDALTSQLARDLAAVRRLSRPLAA